MQLHEVEELIKQVQALQAQEEDEAAPYAHKYEAADLLKQQAEKLQAQLQQQGAAGSAGDGSAEGSAGQQGQGEEGKAAQQGNGNDDQSELQFKLAVLQVRRGIILLETDLLPDGEASINEGLPSLQAAVDAVQEPVPSSSDSHAREAAPLLQEACNSMGALYSGRTELDAALRWLEKALAVYQKAKGWGPPPARPISTDAAAAAAGAAAAAAEPSGAAGAETGKQQEEAKRESQDEPKQEQAEQQAGEHAGSDSKASPATGDAAKEAAGQAGQGATQGVDLEAGHTTTLFFLAQVHGHAGRRDRSALYCAATLQRQLASGAYQLSDWVQNCLQLAGYYVSASAFALAQYCLEAARALVSQQAAAGRQLDDDVKANCELAWAKFYLYRLRDSHAVTVEAREVEMPYPSVSSFPDLLTFPSLGDALSRPDTLPWGKDALAKDFEGARELFNTGMTHFKAGMEYYQLEGFVTEHVETTLEVSNMFRLLAGFERDATRRVAMHKQRAARLEPLSGQLNTQHYLGLSRSIDLECANAWRDALEARLDAVDEAAKPGTAMPKAVGQYANASTDFYMRFLDSYHPEPGKPPPGRIEADHERLYLTAAFNLGRVLHRCSLGNVASSEMQVQAKAHTHLRWVADYVDRHKVEEFKEEAVLARQMAELVAERIKLSQRAAAAAAARR